MRTISAVWSACGPSPQLRTFTEAVLIVRIHLTGAITKWLSCSGKPTTAPNIPAMLFNFQLVRFQVIPEQILLKGKEKITSWNQTHIWSVLSGRGAFIPATSLTGFENLEYCSFQNQFRLHREVKPWSISRNTFLLPSFGAQCWSNRELKLLWLLKLLSQNSWASPYHQPWWWHFPCSESGSLLVLTAGRWSRDTGGEVTWSTVYLL